MVTTSASLAQQHEINSHHQHQQQQPQQSYNPVAVSANRSMAAPASSQGVVYTTSVHNPDVALPATSVAAVDTNSTAPLPASSQSSGPPPATKARAKIVIKDTDNKEIDLKAIASTVSCPSFQFFRMRELEECTVYPDEFRDI